MTGPIGSRSGQLHRRSVVVFPFWVGQEDKHSTQSSVYHGIRASVLSIFGTATTLRLLCEPWPSLNNNTAHRLPSSPGIQRLFVCSGVDTIIHGTICSTILSAYLVGCIMFPVCALHVHQDCRYLRAVPRAYIRKGCIVIPICRTSDIPQQFMVKLKFKNKRD